MLEKVSNKDIRKLNAILAKALSYDRQGMLAEAARSYRFFLSKRQEAIAYYNYAVVLKKMNLHQEAILNYENAIALKPDYAEAYANLGNIYQEMREYEKALEQYDKAIHFGPMLATAFYNRGVVLQELRRHEDALQDYDRTLFLQPNDYLAYLNKSVVLYELKRKAEATLNYGQILRADPENIDAAWNLGILKLSEGDFATGWKLSETRLRPRADFYNNLFQKPYWNGQENIDGRTLFIKWEQGFGDTIQFCRYARLVKNAGAKVVLSVQDPLRRLVATLDDEIAVIGEDERPQQFDYYCFLMSLPCIFRTTGETIPYPTRYLQTEAGEISRWKARIAKIPGLKVGLVWAGGERANITCARRNDANRSLPLKRFVPLLEVNGAAFFSLQKGPPADQLPEVQACFAIHDWADALTDFADTGALIENLDLVITVDTAVAHLAAALGKPVWVLLPWVSCWRWLEGRTTSPWYSSVRLFRQVERGDWDTVLTDICQELRRLLASKQPNS